MKLFIRVSDFPRSWSVLPGIHIGFNDFLHVLWIYVPRSNKFSSSLKIRAGELLMLTFFLCSYPEIPTVQTKEHTVVVDCLLWPYSRNGRRQSRGHPGKRFCCVCWPVSLPQPLLFCSSILSTWVSPPPAPPSSFMPTASPIMSPAFLVLPHLRAHPPCLYLRALCLLPRGPTTAPLPRGSQLLQRRPWAQRWSTKLKLKMKNDIWRGL